MTNAMTHPDDRLQFAAHAQKNAIALGEDRQAFAAATQALFLADRHRYTYLWRWCGLPIIQLPADILTTQEIIWETKPDIIIETGVARGGSVIFLASLCRLIGKGHVIGVDVDIRSHNRESIESHPFANHITLIEGSSTAPQTLESVKKLIPHGASVMVILDSDHSKAHVLKELEAFAPLVTKGCYLVVADTLLGIVDDHPTQGRVEPLKKGNDPLAALGAYLKTTDRFEKDEAINGKQIFASSPQGYLRCIRS
jgi:cephalosporin hydroxylase